MKLLSFLFCFSSLIVTAQFEAVFYEDVITDTIYSFKSENQEKLNYDLVFPPYEYGEKHLRGGLHVNEILKDKKVSALFPSKKAIEDYRLVWSTSFEGKSVDLENSSNLGLFCRLETKNIEKLHFVLFSDDSKEWYYKELKVPENGFLTPIQFNLKDFSRENAFFKGSNSNPTLLNSFSIVASTKSSNGSFSIYDLIIGNKNQKRLKVNHRFFKALLNQEETLLKKNVYELIDVTNEIYDNTLITGTINLEPIEGSNPDEKTLIYEILNLAFEYYPFYSEKKIKKRVIKMKFSSYWDTIRDLELCELISKIDEFVSKNFNDAHFGVELASACKNEMGKPSKLRGPVRGVFIGKELYVGAVLNEKFSKLKIGSKIKVINGKKVSHIVDSLWNNSKSAEHRRIKYIEREILSGYKSDSTHIVYEDDTNLTDSLFITYNQKSRIPKGFKLLKHCEFKKFNDSISYFSIKNWYLDTYLKFMNHSHELIDSKRIILDLRGNGGGEDLSSIRLFSTFLDTSLTYSKTVINGEEQLLVVKPNPYLRLSDKKVIIIGDWLTACSSESFIMAMLQLPNVQFISTAKTYGSMATRYNLVLPSKNIIYINGLAGKNVLMGEIEDSGIEPTIKPQIQKVRDLLPYEDKVLSTALDPMDHWLIMTKN
ncbi:S41 family peptidase [Flagellimonas meridianipacifica]|uniref:Peptidase S41-like protein n=1 Tax=Flagellimonas meridianipacifica TaxID=1080225 RepID=A0A2T0MFM9_9FLAO|nr:S41 family peptidase [Allomuricauda pacifica]PRX56387.1 peptidase S41-like protein [Allomuricauda pacifica]